MSCRIGIITQGDRYSSIGEYLPVDRPNHRTCLDHILSIPWKNIRSV